MAMFKAKTEGEPATPQGGLSVIAAGMTVRGDIESNGTLKVEGAVHGSVQARQQVLVARGGMVHGDIEAREAIIGGAVDGSIRALERVEIQAGAVVSGDITTRRIAVAEGGSLNGVIRMGEQLPAAHESKPLQHRERQPGVTVATAVTSMRPSVPVARIAVPPRAPSAGTGH